MLSLFPEAPPPEPPIPALPSGFRYDREFLTPEEESELLWRIGGLTLRHSQYHEYTARRLTAGFGLRWNYDRGALDEAPPAPPFLYAFVEKVARHLGVDPRTFPAALVTEYPPGAPIGWHRDAPPYSVIVGISLGSACNFRLRPFQRSLQTKEATINIPVQPRSLYVMSGASRSEWQHSITPVKDRRWSITLRTLKRM
jgi:alkylated DNA repair dioxygenase AlkB